MVRVRPATRIDADAIRAVHLAAFPTAQEADLVDRLVAGGFAVISLVAEDKNRGVVGHVLLSRMTVSGGGRAWRTAGLAPIAVLLERQRQGIGGDLVMAALRMAEDRGEELVFLLGEPAYYRRFGFLAETAAPFASPYAGPYFMAVSFGAALPQAGRADYPAPFADLS